MGCLYGISHYVAISITGDLHRGFLEEFFHLLVRGARLAIFQFDDVAVHHVLVDVAKRGEEDVGIAAIIVQLGDRAIEAALACHRQGETMHESLALLLVTLRRIAFQTVGDELEISLVVAMICQLALQLGLVISIVDQVVLLVGIEKIGVHLVTYHLVRDDEFCGTIVFPIYRYHAEIEEQAHEVVRVVDLVGWEVFYELACNVSLGDQLLDDTGVMGEFLVMTDEQAQLVVVGANIALHHVLWDVVIASDVIVQEVEHHHRIVHGGFSIAFLGKTVVVVPWLHHGDKLVHSVVERQHA